MKQRRDKEAESNDVAQAQDTLPALPPGWAWAKVCEVGAVKLGRQRSPEHHTGDHMRPYLRVANVYEDRIDLSDVLQMNFTPQEFEQYQLRYGDILLNELADRMREAVRESDLVARLGGDEFAVLLEGMHDGEALQRLVAKLLTVLAQPVDCEGSQAAVSASIGIALAPEDGATPEGLLRCADRAMYAAKAAGRSTALFYGQLDIAGNP